MGFWNNIKQADYSFEKLLLQGIGSIFLCVCFFYFSDKALDKLPELKSFIAYNAVGFKAFIVISILVFFVHYIWYTGSLGVFEEETENSIRVAKICVLLWSLTWIAWGVYCGQLFLSYPRNTALIPGFVMSLAIFPPLLVLFFTEKIRRKNLKEEAEAATQFPGQAESDPYIFVKERKLFAGYYSLLSIVFFILVVIIGLLV